MVKIRTFFPQRELIVNLSPASHCLVFTPPPPYLQVERVRSFFTHN